MKGMGKLVAIVAALIATLMVLGPTDARAWNLAFGNQGSQTDSYFEAVYSSGSLTATNYLYSSVIDCRNAAALHIQMATSCTTGRSIQPMIEWLQGDPTTGSINRGPYSAMSYTRGKVLPSGYYSVSEGFLYTNSMATTTQDTPTSIAIVSVGTFQATIPTRGPFARLCFYHEASDTDDFMKAWVCRRYAPYQSMRAKNFATGAANGTLRWF